MNHDTWVEEYLRIRYLREVHDDVLERRYRDVASNLWSTDASGKVVPVGPDNWDQLLRRVVDVVVEQGIRAGRNDFTINGAAIAKAAASAYQPPVLKSPFSGSADCFTKFGKKTHLVQTFSRGMIRIAPASSYDDPSLNAAQIDKELEHLTITPNEQLKFNIYGNDAAGNKTELPVRPKELFRYMLVPDFYVWCCGQNYFPRMFSDFEADAVLVIHDMTAFRAKLVAAVEVPGGKITENRIAYYDPYTVQRNDLVPIFSKHFRYLYQNEYRFAWTLNEERKLNPFFVELGPLHDIAELLELS